MPNATPNQPLNQHPIPGPGRYVLGADSLILEGLDAVSDFLVVPPPGVGSIREVPSEDSSGIMVSSVGGGVDADFELVYKDGNGNEIVVAAGSVTAAGGTTEAAAPGPFYLTPDDLGLFLRFSAGDGALTSYSQWFDVRNVERQDTDLSDVSQTLNPEVPGGNALLLANPALEEVAAYIFNHDSVDHGVDLVLTDGSISVPLFGATIPILAGEIAQLPAINLTLPTGWDLQAVLTEAVTTTAPIASVPWSLTNQAPVRQDQGGAF